MGGGEIAPLRQIGRTTPPHLYPPPFSACIYALGKNGSITSPRRWERLFQSARRAKVDLIRVEASVTNHSRFPVPCCKNVAYLGLWLSNLRIWEKAVQTCKSEWVILLENDALLPSNFVSRFRTYARPSLDVLWMDSRNGFHPGPSGCCTVGMAYRKSSLPRLIPHFELGREDAFYRRGTWKKTTCLFDWYLPAVVRGVGLRSYTVGIVRHPPTNREKDS